MSVLKATHRESVRSSAAEHDGIVTFKEEVGGGGAINRTAPIVTVRPNITERTIVAVAVARHLQFQW